MPDDSPTIHNDPRSTYQEREIDGFTVLVSRRVLDHPGDAVADIGQLALQIRNIDRVVPAKPLGVLKKVTIWLEWAEEAGLGQFHWDANYLRRVGKNPEKARSVEIVNARHMLQWSREQPWAVLHELAHAYHCLVLTIDHPGIKNAFDHATRSKSYDLVDYALGGKRAAYALTDEREFFAELTEAYFGHNDFQPFDRQDLKNFDPVGYQLMVDVWGLPAAAPDSPTR